jgi:hypothetical protein
VILASLLDNATEALLVGVLLGVILVLVVQRMGK